MKYIWLAIFSGTVWESMTLTKESEEFAVEGSSGAFSMQFVASSSADYIAPGSSKTFTFSSGDSPAVLASDTAHYSDHNPITTTVAYPAGLFSSAGDQFSFSVVSVPEPSAYALAGLSALASGIAGWRRLRPAAFKAE